ncbi:LamG-like jellyroll fold domain-containing protein [Streptomyces kanamyceticus]|uniref:LamG domain-containing protein n=1 Tax=Streptomyces kanamyceticus TaxID=1967 RepID=A0A5J6GE41_STRKN|nr:LamG-like jellyroll fold domain-containing protein [Streptomyces kanamyceticus]QEU93799.1 LamG domain-containing protein [Streptomyces kanamyceticus]
MWGFAPSRGAAGALAGLVGLGVVAGLTPAAAVSGPVPPDRGGAAASAQKADGKDRLNADAALAAARRTGEPVEVTSLRGESSDVYAAADGNLEAREYLRPVRVRAGSEGWTPVDTDLVKASDGMVSPKATVVRLAFSGGGGAPLVRMTKAGRHLELSWPGRLPEPQLEGDTATYADVLPDVDLRMGAQEDGFTQLLVVKSAKAARSSKLAELRLKLNADGMDVREAAAGSLEALDKGTKSPVFEAPTPMMWDSSASEDGAQQPEAQARFAAALASEDGPRPGGERAVGESGKLAQVGVEIPDSGKELVLTPDADVLKGNDTTYPVFIDPQWYSPRASAWTMASKYWAGSPQWKFNGEHTAGLGYCNWSYCKPHDTKRLFYRIPVSKFAGKSILSAEFVVRNTWSASCGARSVELWQTKDISSSTTWNSQNASGFWKKKLKAESFAHGFNGCASKDAEFDVKSAVQSAASKRDSTMTFGMQAGSESDKYGWKRFSDKAFLRVKYNRPPPQVKMSQLSMEYGGVCKRSDKAARVRTLGKIKVKDVTDPDKDSVSVQFQAKWDAGDGKGLIARWNPARTSAKKSGSRFSVSLPKSIPANKTVHWYVRSYDGAQYSPWSHAGDPTGCYFVYDTSVPRAPSLTSGEYPASDPESPDDPWFDGVGQYGTFALKSASKDVDRYRYGINTDPSAKNEISTSGGATRDVKVLPGKPGLNFVTAQAFDKAGNGSEIRLYEFRVKAGQPERATWKLDEGRTAKEAKGSTPARVATLHGGATPGAQGVRGQALQLDGSSGYAATDVPVVDTDRGFTVSAWAKLDKKPEGAAVIAAQPGNHRSGFELYYSAYHDRWVFNQYAVDSTDAQATRAMADKPGGVEVGEWTHLVGSYDSIDRKIRLYIDNKLAGEAPLPKAWNARRGLMIGASSYDGKPGSYFPGAIDDVQIFDKRIAADEVDKLKRHERIGDPGRPAMALFALDEKADATEVQGHGDVLPAVYHGGVTTGRAGVAGKATKFNGTDGYARIGRTSGPHVNTSRSFTISAWAKLDRKPDGAAVITAQAGKERPGFELYYSSAYGRWAFNQYSSDAADAKPIRAMQPDGTSARTGEWAHLTGVHDTVANTLTLYVNGSKAGSTKLAGAFYADQSMYIGASSYSGNITSHFPGEIDDVRLFDRPVSADEARQLFRQRAVVKGRWLFDDTATDGTAPDASDWGNGMSLHGGARVHAEGAYLGDSGLVLNGTSGYAATSAVPVDTGSSFTVTAWAQAAAMPKDGVALVSAEGTKQSAFSIRFVPDTKAPDGPGRWEVVVPDKDDGAPTVRRIAHSDFFDVREWNHLALVYDGFAKEARLYVNGALQEAACSDDDGDGGGDDEGCTDLFSQGDNVLSFKASKSLQVGRAKTDGAWGDYWPGAVDDVWAFQGALTDDQVNWLSRQWFDVPTELPADE